MSKNNLPTYVRINVEELQALATVSGEALRLYLAISSFAMGPKTTCYPKWSQIKEVMGKPNADTRNIQKIVKKLEDAGLIKRGNFGTAEYKNRFQLPLKKQVIERGLKSPPKEGKINHPGTVETTTTPWLKSPPINNKLNKKLNNKFNHNKKSREIEGKCIEFSILPSPGDRQFELLHKLETTPGSKLLWDYDPEDIKKLLDGLTKDPHLFPVSKKKMIKFLEDWNVDDF